MTQTEKDTAQQRRQATNEAVQNLTSVSQAGQPNYNTIYAGSCAVPGPGFSPTYPQDVRNIAIGSSKKSLVEAYLLWFIFGFHGAHHFYLRRVEWGILYFLTGGLVGCGWIIDFFRLPYLVSQANKRITDETSVKPKNISDAYTLWFPFGLLGFHHFYLGNPLMGGLYFLTCGLFGIGWLIDLVRIPSLVKEANLRDPTIKEEKSVGAAYALGVSPLGVLGFHHFYLNRPLWGFLYLLTVGLCGIGWLVDWFRIPLLVKRANKELKLGADVDKHLDDAYLLWIPFGILGLHHFYLRRPVWGLVYFITGGFFGIGWLVDCCRMPCLVEECNRKTHEQIERLPVYQVPYSGVVVTRTDVTSGYSHGAAPPSYENPTYQAPIYPAIPSTGYQCPPQAGYQQTNGAAQIPSYVEQPPPYSSPDDKQPTSGTDNTSAK